MAPQTKLVTSDELRKNMNRKKRMLVVFSGKWCPDCQEFEPILKRWVSSISGPVTVLRVEVPRDGDEWEDWDLDEIPTVAAYSDGKEHARVHGMMSEEDLRALLDGIA